MMYISYLVIALGKLLSSSAALPLGTFLLVVVTLILVIFSYYNSKLLRILNAESIHFPQIRETVNILINRIDRINEIVVTNLPFQWSRNSNPDYLINYLYNDNQEENLLISDFIQFHTFNIKRRKEICNSIQHLGILFGDYKTINNKLIETIKEIIGKGLNNNDIKDVEYDTNPSNCTNCYNDHYVKFIAISWGREIFDINKTSYNPVREINIRESNISNIDKIYILITQSGQQLCHVKLQDDVEKLKEIFENLTTNFTQLNEFKIYKKEIQENRENFQKHYKIVKDILEKMKFHVKFKGKCEFLGGRKELKNIITKEGINCKI